MTIFEQAISDLWGHSDFLSEFVYEGKTYRGWITKKEESVVYSESGLEEESPFTISVKPDTMVKLPKRADRITFGGEEYKVLSVEWDSARASIAFDVVKPSKGV